jgi:hypothetical protein
VLDVGVNGATVPTFFPSIAIVIVVVVSIELRGVFSFLDLARGNNAEHGDFDLSSGLGRLVVVVIIIHILRRIVRV